MNDSKCAIKISPAVLLLFCLYVCPVMFKGPSFISYIYIYLVPAAYLVVHYRSTFVLTVRQAIILCVAAFLIVLSLVFPVIHATGDLSYTVVTTYIFRKLVVYAFLAHVLVRHYKEETSIQHFMYYFSLVQALYVVVTLLFVFIPSIKSLWFSIFNEVISSEEFQDTFGYTFRIGWQGFSGFGSTIFCSLSCIFLMYLRYARNSRIQLSLAQFIIPLSLSLLGNMFYGRSGLVVSIISCAVSLLLWNRRRFGNILMMTAFMAVALLVLYTLRDLPILSSWYYWMSKPIINLFTSGSFNNVSINATHDMVFMPSTKTVLLGDGLYTVDGHYYMYTDSGIMRNILFWGILGFIVSYGMTVVILFETRKLSWLLFIILLGALAAFEYKGHMYYDFASLVLAFSFVDSIKRNTAWSPLRYVEEK